MAAVFVSAECPAAALCSGVVSHAAHRHRQESGDAPVSRHTEQPQRTSNENFAPGFFELFTLGEGHYNEQDIKEAARAFTGWHLDFHTGAFRVDLRHHDDGRKVVFGKSGPFEGDDILLLTLEQPQVARYIVGKLWREFISDRPDSLEVDRLADSFKKKNYEIAGLLQDLLLSPQF